jgi:ABC-type branched-subunit amino acid transport system ATPase component
VTFIGKGILIVIAAVGILVATLSIALGQKEKLLSDEGASSKEVFRLKISFLVGLIPIALLSVFILGFTKIGTLTDFGEENPRTEKDFRRIVERRSSEYKEALSDFEDKKSDFKAAKEERESIKREFHSTNLIEEKSQLEEDFLAHEEKYNQIILEMKNLIPELNEKKQRLDLARSVLKRFRSGTYHKPLKVEAPKDLPFREKALIYWGFLWKAALFLLGSFGMSYVVAGITEKRKSRLYERFANACLTIWAPLSTLGRIPIDSLMSAFLVPVPKERDIFQTQIMKLGPGPKAYLTDRNLNYHTQIIGGSGAGKTNLLKVMIEDRIRKGHGVIFFDFKADIELMDWITGLSESAGRREDLRMISMSDPAVSHTYNPLQYGSETEITSQIMNALTWSEQFYKDVAESGLMIIVKALCFRRDQAGASFYLNDLYAFLTDSNARMDFLGEILNLGYPERHRWELRRVCEELMSKKKDNYQGLINQLSKIMNSSAGEIVSGTPGYEAEFNFKDAIQNGQIAYLFMNSLKLKETASVMGKLMLQDLMKTVGGIYDDRSFNKRPVTLIIDEFASFATPDFGEFIEKARGAGIGVIVAYQSLQSLKSIEGDLALKMNENTANKVVFQVQDGADAEWFCGLLGTQKVEKETHQAEEEMFFGDKKTGMKSVREVEEYVVHPNQLKSLKTGEALLVSTKVDVHFSLIKIHLAEEYSTEYIKHRTGSSTMIIGSDNKSQGEKALEIVDLI